jgi:UDP-2-acetamido-3-amino-2,3-dideoxy-glucuronate N-acetyltransferase
MNYWAHDTAIVDTGAQVGAGTKIWHWVHVCAGARIGANCVLGQNVFVGNKVVIGNNVRIQNNVSVYDDVTLEDDVFCGPSMVFTNVINPRSHVSRKDEYLKTLVRRGASIGANATVVCGYELGEYSFIGAGAVVTRDVPGYALMVGMPARRIGWMCQCGERLPSRVGAASCAKCGARYRIGKQACQPVSPSGSGQWTGGSGQRKG